MSDAEPLIPDITDEDINWVCSLMGLDPFDEPRREFLMRRSTQRLLQTYVAMTRPSHLLCLAIPRFALGGGDAIDRNIQTLKCKGWRVAEIVDGLVQWRD